MVGAVTADPLATADRAALHIAVVDMALVEANTAVGAIRDRGRPVPSCFFVHLKTRRRKSCGNRCPMRDGPDRPN